MKKVLGWVAGILGILLLVIGLGLAFIDEPLRAYAERTLNSRVEDYRFRIGVLDFHPIGFSVDLKDITVVQKDHPDPPVAHIPQWSASVHWRDLLTGNLVSDHVMDQPKLHITRPQAKKESQEPEKKVAWQETLLAVYPLTINKFTVNGGDITYVDSARAKPLHVGDVNLTAENIRNIRSTEDTYPSRVRLESQVFDTGTLKIDGSADFLAQPHLGLNVDIQLDHVDLDDLISLAGRYQFQVRKGVLSAQGHVEYSPQTKVIKLTTLKMDGVRLDYIHTAQPNKAGKEVAKEAARKAKEADNDPELLLRIDQGMIENSEFGFVNKAVKPEYRLFLNGTDIYLENFSNQLSEGTAIVRLRGMFMGNGPTQLNGVFRPEIKSPDFDLDIRVVKAQVKSMNDLLRAYGDFDVTSGLFSVYTEFKVKNGKIDGYVKPLFKNLDVYDPAQDKDKGLLSKIYESVIGGVSELLKNAPRDEVATKAEVSGTVKNPSSSTWEVVVKLIQNAFFDAILPGFEGRGRGEPKK
ncbi:MAG TPA: DUF748 domain-containing protein [Nitrospiraceae bacterium]|nr:DUF748 domain-containing protein [Nitrospiraceae bacterium]